MKLTIYLFLFSLFQIHANSYSQNAKVTLELNNVSVKKVFRAIEAQTEFKLLYNDNELDYKKKVSVSVRNTLVTEVLNNLFKGTDINYKTVGKQIVLVKEQPKKVQAAVSENQQQIYVKGVVKDEFDMPVPGANVLVKGTDRGAITDFDGNYQIRVDDANSVLVFSYVGFKEKEVVVGSQKTINVILEQDVSELDAVVMVGYGTVKKSDVTGAVASVATEEITKTQNTSIAQAIQGRAAGVSVSKSSGTPGATPTVRIRGVGTVNNADPLYVVDGVPISDVSNINMEDAKSVEVLKDASATAIYGSRGANGVILITTKGGKKGKPTISYKAYFGVEERVDNLDVFNAEQYASIYNEALVNDGKPINNDFANPSNLTTYNWKDAAFQTGMQQNHQLAISGGTEKSTYYVSLGLIEQEGIVKESSYKRTNFRVNNTYQIKPKIKIGHNIQYAYSDRLSVPLYGGNSNTKTSFVGYVIDPVSPLYNQNGDLTGALYGSGLEINPLALIKYGRSPQIRENFFGNVFLEAQIMDGLVFRSNYGLEINNTKVDNYRPAFFVQQAYNNPVSTYNLARAENRVMVLSNTLNYQTTIAKDHSINVLLGQEIQELDYNNVSAARSDIPESVANPTLDAGDISTASNGGGISESKLLSFFGRFNYNYKDRYLLTGTYRMDGSSRFGANNRWAQFPSLAAAWNLHNEDFYQIDAINQLKLRVGWGETGNQDIPNSAVFNTLNIGTNYLYGSDEATAQGVAPLRPGNPDLKWETTVTKNIGIDLALLKNAITFSAEYFVKNTTDMLLATPISELSGYAENPYTNAGDIENKGLELTASYRKNINDFSFQVGGNISFIKNKVKKLVSEGSIIQTGNANQLYNMSRTEAGHSLASFYGLNMIGLFQNQEEIDNYASLPNAKPGDVKYEDLNGDGEINDDDRMYIGSPFADFTYGINLDMQYKQFDFTAFFQGSYGNDVFNSTRRLLEADYNSNSSTTVLNRWTGEGTSNSVPRVTFDNAGNNARLSSRFVEDGSYLRLKNVQIGYNFSKTLLKNTLLSKARIYVAGQNLVTFTNYSGLDPELGVDTSQASPLDIGIDRGRFPTVRTYTVGLDINF
ncbi:TonB-dependent receptor [Ochrovirga pacifica]|uniref:TonB-dependent receptor n=1 Tax=Ochrovirga pacifica TaxID=1042376 RepID=UPI00030CEAA5|nr:TonB-dependent receptor [Ochrovirga pacifica]